MSSFRVAIFVNARFPGALQIVFTRLAGCARRGVAVAQRLET
jgi:hypothetical protein